MLLLVPAALALTPELDERLSLRAQELSVELKRPAEDLETVLRREVEARLEDRPAELNGHERVARTVVDYEAFRLSAYTRSGVSPKRYFGYLDELGDTAEHETVLIDSAIASRRVCNAWLEEQGSSLRVTDQEILVTLLAEGGALWLGDPRPLHPILDVGLDDIASGSSDLAPLRDRLDAELGTDLGAQDAEYDLSEAVAGTALMWVWEKDIADRKLRGQGLRPIHVRDADEQFIVGSLVYNSGILHSPERWVQIRDFEAAQVVWDKSQANAKSRWLLPLVHPDKALDQLIAGAAYPYQGTDWLAMMHVLQRYGAYVALSRFTDHFDAQGAFRPRSRGGSAREEGR